MRVASAFSFSPYFDEGEWHDEIRIYWRCRGSLLRVDGPSYGATPGHPRRRLHPKRRLPGPRGRKSLHQRGGLYRLERLGLPRRLGRPQRLQLFALQPFASPCREFWLVAAVAARRLVIRRADQRFGVSIV